MTSPSHISSFQIFCVLLLAVSGGATAGGDALFYNKEIRLGLLSHNNGPIASHTEDGPDLNAAIHYLVTDTNLGNKPVAIYAHAGVVLNLDEGTSYLYIGGNWQMPIRHSSYFWEMGGGFAAHDGEIDHPTEENRALGSRILFRFETGVGYRFDNDVTVSLMFDHVSNGGVLGDFQNKGLDTFGLRVGMPF